jgi:hypothetical protein
MFTRKRKPGLATTAALGLVDDPAIRHAALEATQPVAKLGLNVGKRFAQRRAQRRLEQLSDAFNALGALAAAYGPIVARQLGLIEEPPKAKRTAPLVAGGALVGASAVYFLEPGSGRRHRQQVQRLVSH